MQPAFFSQLYDFHSNHHNTQRATDCTTLYILVFLVSFYNPKTSSFHLRLVARVYMVCFRCYSFVLLLNQLIQPWNVWSIFIISVSEWKYIFIFLFCYFPPFSTWTTWLSFFSTSKNSLTVSIFVLEYFFFKRAFHLFRTYWAVECFIKLRNATPSNKWTQFNFKKKLFF